MNDKSISTHINELEIAVIGMSGRFPGANSIKAFWENLSNGVESISFFTDEQLRNAGIDSRMISDPSYVRARGIIEDIDLFDANFFGYMPREAELIDPQQRLFLECAWEAIENAGYDTERYQGLIGVYAGVGINTYLLKNLLLNGNENDSDGGLQLLIGSDKDFLATRISYKLNLQGPSVVVQSACSTSLVAVHLACQGLLSGECDMALAGGASVKVPQESGYIYQKGSILSPDGHCRAFDEKAQGSVSGNGIGIVVLKRLADAIADNDHILAVIKGSAINNDGSNKVGYTAPSIDGQSNVITRALLMAEIHPETIGYIETHGTGTELGDPIEIAALTESFRSGTEKKGFCALGSVKTNIGHLDTAAGVTGLIKTVLALKHKKLPPSPNFEKPNPKIDFDNSPFYVNTKLQEWKNVDGDPLRAGVSSFGIGGTNAHVILEEAPQESPSGKSREWQLLTISAKTKTALETATANLAEYLKQSDDRSFADIAYTLKVGRRAFKHRRILVCSHLNDAVEVLMKKDPKRILSGYNDIDDRPVTFMFPGQGAQYVNMALDLYRTEPLFREKVDLCCKLLKEETNIDLLRLIYPPEEEAESATHQLKQTQITQPALFIIEYAMAQLWMSWGIRPKFMIGHSIGEYVAACLSGVFSMEDALRLVAARGRMMQQLPGGAMLAVALPKDKIESLLDKRLTLAAINAPSLCVVSGQTDAVKDLEDRLSGDGVICRPLHTSHAFHSASMDEILEPFARLVRNMDLHPPQTPYISNVTGTWITDSEATDADYWAGHLRRTVLFEPGIEQLLNDPDQIFLEVGPGRTLSTFVERHTKRANSHTVLPSIRHPKDQQHDIPFLLKTLGRLWLSGMKVDWPSFYGHEKRRRIPCPVYPFERESYWVAPRKATPNNMNKGKALDKKSDISEWLYIPSWKRSVPVPYEKEAGTASAQKESMLVFTIRNSMGSKLNQRLKEMGHEIITVTQGENFSRSDSNTFTINPANQEDYDTLIRSLSEQDKLPANIVHLWNITYNGAKCDHYDDLDDLLDKGIFSLLFLTQALGKSGISDPLRITVVTNNMQEVTGDDLLYPEKATLLGPCKVIPKEYPNISCRIIDTLIYEAGSRFEQRLINHLAGELASENSDTIIAFRGNHRLVQTFEPVQLNRPANPVPVLRHGGVYLITGGLGGIGLVLAEHLAKETKARLILTGRSPFPEKDEWDQWLAINNEDDAIGQKIRKLRKIEELGAEVFIVSADVADQRQMEQAIHEAKTRFGQINGVIHSAGLPDGAIIQRRTKETINDIFAPKVKGTLILNEIFKDAELDFFVLCSSLASILGPMGQVGYCAANAFLDAFTFYKRSRDDTSVITINWDTWQEVGMAVKAVEELSNSLYPPISHQHGTKMDHPLFDFKISDDSGKETYVSNLSVEKHWVLNEHKIRSQAILPGTALLEMTRASFENHTGNEAVEMSDVFFLKPLIVGDNEKKEVRTILTKNEDGFDFSIVSSSNPMKNQWSEHVRGAITSVNAGDSEKTEISEIEAICNKGEVIETERLHGSQFNMIEFGPRWRNRIRVKFGENEGMAVLELPDEFINDLESYKIHPALLDSATAFMMGQFREGAQYLPFLWKKIKLLKPLPRKIISFIKYVGDSHSKKETLNFDIFIMNELGDHLMEIKDYTLRRIDIERFAREMSRDRSKDKSPDENIIEGNLLKTGLLPQEGVDVFGRALSNNLPQLIISTQDLDTRIKRSNGATIQQSNETLDKTSRKRPVHTRPEMSTGYMAPRDEHEQIIADVWQELLGIQQIGIQDDFFELGGHSLVATQIISRLHKKFGIELPISGVFESPTIAELADRVKAILLSNISKVSATEGQGSEREEIEI